MIKCRLILIFVSVSAAVFTAGSVLADHPSVAFGAGSSGPIATISASPMSAGYLAVGLRTEIINFDAFTDNQLENFASQGLDDVHSVDRLIKTSLSLSYGFSRDLTLSLQLSHLSRDNIREGELELGVPEAHFHGDSSGYGDTVLLGQQRVYFSDSTNISLVFGAKAPTGDTKVKDRDDIRFETEFQPGSGAWDLILGSAIDTKMGDMSFSASILYNRTTEGAQNTKIGDALFYGAALSYRIGTEQHDHQSTMTHDHGLDWDFILEINGQTRERNTVSSVDKSNSGGTVVYLSPGLKVSSRKGVGAYLSIGIPVIENQYGTQADIDTRVIAGVSFTI